MANYDNKLGDWFKQVEKREKELKAKKTMGDDVSETPKAEPAAPTAWQQPTAPVATAAPAPTAPVAPVARVESVVVEQPVASAPVSSVAQAVETRTVVAQSRAIEESFVGVVEAETETTSEPRAIAVSPSIFEDSEVPQVEDFLSFLNRTEEKPTEPDTFNTVETSRNRGIGHLSEGTGEPRPIVPDRYLEVPPVLGIDKVADQIVDSVVAPAPEVPSSEVIAPAPKPQPNPARKAQQASSLQEKWDRMPHHLQTLFGVSTGEEVAQNSYKAFRESRGQLIQRLLDPPITLEEAARILNVCPTTVRRYTNRGVLKHFRTAGNQRRFRLSDVLVFMETKGRTAQPVSEEIAN